MRGIVPVARCDRVTVRAEAVPAIVKLTNRVPSKVARTLRNGALYAEAPSHLASNSSLGCPAGPIKLRLGGAAVAGGLQRLRRVQPIGYRHRIGISRGVEVWEHSQSKIGGVHRLG